MIQFQCDCAMGSHKAPLEGYDISSGAINNIPEILKDYSKVYMVADTNTYAAAGEAVEKILKAAGKHYRTYVLDGEVILPNTEALGKILLNAADPAAKPNIFAYSDLPDFILAVGSGTINDSCRVVSYRLGLPYGVVGTAPSMDGYASAGSPFLFGGSKATVQCTTPKYIIGDLDILKTSTGSLKKQESSGKTSISALLTAKAFDCVDHNKLWKILKEMGIPDHLICLLRNLYAGQEATVRTGHGTTDWFQIGKGVRQGCILSPCLFNLYAEYIMRNTGLEEAQAGIKIAGEISITSDMQMIPPLWQKVRRN